MNLIQNLLRRRVAAIFGIVVLAVLLIAGWLALGTTRASPNAVAVARGNIIATVTATGKVRAKSSAKLSLPQSGMVASIAKMEGDDVKPGDVILSLRADDANRRVRQAELNLQSRQLDLERAKASPRDADIEIARANLQKATAVAAVADANYTTTPNPQNDAIRLSTRADLDIARANFNGALDGPSQADLDVLQNAITAAQLDLDAAHAALAQTRVTAPYTSTVTEIAAREGELVGGFVPLAVVADLSRLEIAADIDEIDVAHVKVGQLVEVRLDAFPGEQITGQVTRLFPAASTQRGTTTYSAIVDFDPQGLLVRPGMGAPMKIQTIVKDDVLFVPNRALKNAGARKAVHVVAPGDPRDVIIETGVTDGTITEVVSGLNLGDQVQLQ